MNGAQPFAVIVHWSNERGRAQSRQMTVTARHIDEACDMAERAVVNTEILVPRGIWTEATGAI